MSETTAAPARDPDQGDDLMWARRAYDDATTALEALVHRSSLPWDEVGPLLNAQNTAMVELVDHACKRRNATRPHAGEKTSR